MLVRLLLGVATITLVTTLLFRAVVPTYACVCAGSSLEELVVSTDFILIGRGVESLTEPPLNPDSPDGLQHHVYLRFGVEEYLKGGGPAELVLSTSTVYYFNEDGTPGGSFTDCDLLGEWSVDRRYVLFVNGSLGATRDPGTCSGSLSLTEIPGAEEYVQRIRALLQATPTPSPSSAPSPSPLPTSAPTASPTPVPPIGLPRSGGVGASDSSGIFLVVTAVGGALIATGVAARRYR